MRRATITRKTNETDIAVTLDLDGTGAATIRTGRGCTTCASPSHASRRASACRWFRSR